MAGHSKWAKIKRKKGANDKARGKLFSKLSKEITLAAQEGGGDPELNFQLRMAIDKAKEENFPADNIKRAIKKGTGELKGDRIEQIVYEGYGPNNVGLLIRVRTDNTNRAITEIRQIVENQYGGKMSAEGSVAWQFDEKGITYIASKKFKESEKYGVEGEYKSVDSSEAMLELMELPGVEDIEKQDAGGEGSTDAKEGVFEVIVDKNVYSDFSNQVKLAKFKVEDSGLGYVPTQTVKVSDSEVDKLNQLIEDLEDSEEVDEVWHNAEVE